MCPSSRIIFYNGWQENKKLNFSKHTWPFFKIQMIINKVNDVFYGIIKISTKKNKI